MNALAGDITLKNSNAVICPGPTLKFTETTETHSNNKRKTAHGREIVHAEAQQRHTENYHVPGFSL